MSTMVGEKRKPRLRIIFDGVIAVGPPHPNSGNETGPLFGVMARSTRRQSNVSTRDKKAPKYIPMHVPTVMTKLLPKGRPHDEEYQFFIFPKWYVWHPIRERLEFKFDDRNGRGRKLTYHRSDDDDCGNECLQAAPTSNGLGLLGSNPTVGGKLSIRNIDKVPDAREVWPARCKLRTGSLESNPKEVVAAQVFVPRGHISGGGLDAKGLGVEVEFEPLKPKSRTTTKTVVPNVVITVETERVEIATQSLDTGKALDPLVFELKEDADIWIMNGDPVDITGNLGRLSLQLTESEMRSVRGELETMERSSIEAIVALFQTMPNLIPVVFGSNPTDGPRRRDANRESQFDVDFELFYSILGGRDDGKGLPIPRRYNGKPFDERNCFCKLCCPPAALTATRKPKSKPNPKRKR
jgi:hypothetical protein